MKKIKAICKELSKLTIPLESKYKVIEIYASEHGWGAVLPSKPSKYDSKNA